MKYALLIYGDPSAQRTEEEGDALFEEFQKWSEDLKSRGIFVDGSPLAPPGSATTVRKREGKVTITDGPFAEVKEYLGGVTVIEAASLDVALEAASTCPGAKWGSVEIRPIAVF